MNTMYKKFALLVLPLAISGCFSLNPDYTRPEGVVPAQLPTTGIYGQNQPGAITQEQLYWNTYILNPKLKEIVKSSLNNNKDLRIAMANIESAKAQYGITKSDRIPTLNGSISGSRNRGAGGISEGYEANFGISSFEIDAFGRVNSLSSAALESFLSTKEARRVTELSIISETMKAYFNIGLAKSYLAIAKKTETATYDSLQIISKRVAVGVANAKDLSDVESVYFRAQSDVFNYQTQVEQSINALAVLVGSNVDEKLLPEGIVELTDGIKDLNIAVESDVLYQRPDVLMAEHQLLAANANIGAARAAFFPRITLTTSAGVASSDLTSLFSNTFRVWNFSPSINIPIFDYGRTVNNLKYSEAQKDKYVATYEKTVQTAFREVSDVLARKGTIDNQITSYGKFVNANRNSFDLATKSYDAGVSDYLSVLTAQNNLYDAEKSSLSLMKEKFDNKVDLYKVIGF
jgi:multidrug efflux system outer membrane protein